MCDPEDVVLLLFSSSVMKASQDSQASVSSVPKVGVVQLTPPVLSRMRCDWGRSLPFLSLSLS